VTQFAGGLLFGVLLAVVLAASVMAAYISTDLARFEAWLDQQ
jgi:hypothetical protein